MDDFWFLREVVAKKHSVEVQVRNLASNRLGGLTPLIFHSSKSISICLFAQLKSIRHNSIFIQLHLLKYWSLGLMTVDVPGY